MIEMTVAEHQRDLQTKFPKAGVAAHIAHAVLHTTEQSQLNRRYEAQLHRQYLRNAKELRDLQAARPGDEPTLDDSPSPEPPCLPQPSQFRLLRPPPQPRPRHTPGRAAPTADTDVTGGAPPLA